MPSLQLRYLRRIAETGESRDIEFWPGINLLIGDENTSKTTTLRITDFCLGDETNAQRKFGNTIADEYRQFELGLLINTTDHVLVRRLKESRQTTRVDVDGQTMGTAEFNSWIGTMLGWQEISVPRGRSLTTATEEHLLTFRALLRHIYRRADSWTSFALREEEYLRRAVVAFFIGVAQEVYQGTQVQITRTEFEIQELEQRRRDLRTTLDDVVRRAAAGYREAGSTNLDSIGELINEIDSQLREVQRERLRLTEQVQGDTRYDARQDARLAVMHKDIQQLLGDEAQVSQLLGEQRRLLQTLEGDLRRIQRARIATATFSSFMVTTCPACYQPIERPGEDNTNSDHCYVCHQPISEDIRQRRLELEENTLRSERTELEEVVSELSVRLQAIRERAVALRRERERLLAALDQERQTLITPLLREFEHVQYRLGQLEQRRESLLRLAQLQERAVRLDRERQAVEEKLHQLRTTAAARSTDRGLIIARTNRLGELMNEFVGQLPMPEGIGGAVSVDTTDFSFYVGREAWDHALGNERRVIFLLAYHYALLKLAVEEDTPHPRLVILDNPFQQDVDPHLVTLGLELLRQCCEGREDMQLIVTTRRRLPEISAHRIDFERVFNPEPGIRG